MNVETSTTSGSRWEPGSGAVRPPAPPAAPVVRGRWLTGPVVAGALGLAVLTGLGGFALGLAVGGDGTSQVRQDPGQVSGQDGVPDGRRDRGDGSLGTAPDGQGT
ncbi:hypothetical protein [Lentzea sp. NPDC060358]|uniref:hypothetical protein n=1 Tax=Lentzea sp. NPDC060358 TaxID=3347103 RepID=UPI00365ABC53